MSLFAFLLSLIWPQLLCDRLPTISSFILEINTCKLRYCADERFPPLFTSTQFCDGVRNVLSLMDTDRTTNQPLQGRSFGEDWQGKRFNHNLNHNIVEKWTQNGNITEFCSRLCSLIFLTEPKMQFYFFQFKRVKEFHTSTLFFSRNLDANRLTLLNHKTFYGLANLKDM